MLKINSPGAGQPTSSPLNVSIPSGALWSIYLPHLLIVIVITVGVLLRLQEYPLSWFDEGYTTHVARLLVEKGVYGTTLLDSRRLPLLSLAVPVWCYLLQSCLTYLDLALLRHGWPCFHIRCHPDSTYVISSIWDLAMHQPIVLNYDLLQANPAYLNYRAL